MGDKKNMSFIKVCMVNKKNQKQNKTFKKKLEFHNTNLSYILYPHFKSLTIASTVKL